MRTLFYWSVVQHVRGLFRSVGSLYERKVVCVNPYETVTVRPYMGTRIDQLYVCVSVVGHACTRDDIPPVMAFAATKCCRFHVLSARFGTTKRKVSRVEDSVQM